MEREIGPKNLGVLKQIDVERLNDLSYAARSMLEVVDGLNRKNGVDVGFVEETELLNELVPNTCRYEAVVYDGPGALGQRLVLVAKNPYLNKETPLMGVAKIGEHLIFAGLIKPDVNVVAYKEATSSVDGEHLTQQLWGFLRDPEGHMADAGGGVFVTFNGLLLSKKVS